MIELYQIPYSPFCIVTRRMLEYSGERFKIINVPNGDRSLIWKITRERYYQVPVIRDGKTVVFETGDNSQVIAKYLDGKFGLGLFPKGFEGIQNIIWSHIENEIEGLTFKLNDISARERVPKSDWLRFLRHKERKFGQGCLEQWRAHAPEMLKQLSERLGFFERMLATRPFLLDGRPRFVDFDLFGMLGNFLYSGHYALPAEHNQIQLWHARMQKIKHPPAASEKLRP